MVLRRYQVDAGLQRSVLLLYVFNQATSWCIHQATWRALATCHSLSLAKFGVHAALAAVVNSHLSMNTELLQAGNFPGKFPGCGCAFAVMDAAPIAFKQLFLLAFIASLSTVSTWMDEVRL